jgi:uncharacterized protein (DUF58 family)
LRGFAVITRFPFGLFSKSLWIEDEESLLVYPAVERVPISRPRGAEQRDGSHSRGVAGESALAAGLRGYTPGDPRRRIHWRASLRAGGLLVRNLESERDTDALVLLRTEHERPGQAFEARVRRAASEVVGLLDAGRRVALCAGEQRFAADAGAGQRAVLLGFLAQVQPDAGAPR